MSERPSTPAQQATIDEALSAMVDGEASELEVRRLLKLMDEDPTLQARWERYQVASAAIKSETPEVPYMDLSASISAAIDDEETYTGTPSSETSESAKPKGFWNGIGRFAIAASVAGAVVLGVQYGTGSGDAVTGAGPIAENTVESPATTDEVQSLAPRGANATVVSQQLGVNTPIQQNRPVIEISPGDLERAEKARKNAQEVQQQLNRLMLEHVQNTSQNTQQGVLPYARIPAEE